MPLLQDLTTNEVTSLRCEEYAGLPLAIEESWPYQQFDLELPKHSRLLMYTDGLEEAFPPDDDGDGQFGVAGIISSLKSSADLPLDDALEKLFSESDLQRQTAMLTMALVSVKPYPTLHAPSHAYLKVLGTKHRARGISRELYPKFVEVLVEKVAEFHGDDWNESIDKQWTDALNLAVATMHEGDDD